MKQTIYDTKYQYFDNNVNFHIGIIFPVAGELSILSLDGTHTYHTAGCP